MIFTIEQDTTVLIETLQSVAALIEQEIGGGKSVIEAGIMHQYERVRERYTNKYEDVLDKLNRSFFLSHRDTVGGTWYQAAPLLIKIKDDVAVLKSTISEKPINLLISSPDFSFLNDPNIKQIAESDFKELSKSLIQENWKCVLILCGGLIEAILLDVLKNNSALALVAKAAPKEPNLDKWKFNDIIDVAEELKIIGPDIERLSDTVRDYRNLIHPGKQIRSRLKVKPEESKIAFEVLNIVVRELS